MAGGVRRPGLRSDTRGWAARHATPDSGWEAAAPLGRSLLAPHRL